MLPRGFTGPTTVIPEGHIQEGKVECTRDELLGFVRFLHGNYIVRPFYYESYRLSVILHEHKPYCYYMKVRR